MGWMCLEAVGQASPAGRWAARGEAGAVGAKMEAAGGRGGDGGCGGEAAPSYMCVPIGGSGKSTLRIAVIPLAPSPSRNWTRASELDFSCRGGSTFAAKSTLVGLEVAARGSCSGAATTS